MLMTQHATQLHGIVAALENGQREYEVEIERMEVGLSTLDSQLLNEDEEECEEGEGHRLFRTSLLIDLLDVEALDVSSAQKDELDEVVLRGNDDGEGTLEGVHLLYIH